MQYNSYSPLQHNDLSQTYTKSQQGYLNPIVSSMTFDPYEDLNKGKLLAYKFACILFAVFCLVSLVMSALGYFTPSTYVEYYIIIDIVMFSTGAVAGVMGFLANHNKDLPKAKLAFRLFVVHIVIYLAAWGYIGFLFDTLARLLPRMIIRVVVFTLIYLNGSMTSQRILEKA